MSFAGKKVFVAEADPIILVLVSHILARNGLTVHWARDARSAAELLAGERYDVAVVDEQLIDGTVIATAPDLLPRTVLLTCSPASTPHDGSVHSVLKKPVEIDALVAAVRAVIA